MTKINTASNELESLIQTRKVSDRTVRSLQISLSIHVSKPFQDLQRKLVIQTDSGKVVDRAAGLCTFANDEEQKVEFLNFYSYLTEQRKDYATESIRDCLSVMDSLYRGVPCLFSKTNGFRVFAT